MLNSATKLQPMSRGLLMQLANISAMLEVAMILKRHMKLIVLVKLDTVAVLMVLVEQGTDVVFMVFAEQHAVTVLAVFVKHNSIVSFTAKKVMPIAVTGVWVP
ncbi:hypothetical protein COEREDRAFT_11685 [Coemansia reversa NRRL 1564]|uniref:Uncharacterized protein n=1 Tax=Coemansia reversa (strain ATCC 12441 / NRRL 1564) TaxID=763665 RepID=A0A2G5B2E4_COERN|nr:hypothetical protein COEREDRAFT_11685 [Coemansia reversa NRRL 1564]|eukprot:PIA13192.1 hypothetical protein COEREDRAFT_11685 [Coemansia reversa NRRL 1564]